MDGCFGLPVRDTRTVHVLGGTVGSVYESQGWIPTTVGMRLERRTIPEKVRLTMRSLYHSLTHSHKLLEDNACNVPERSAEVQTYIGETTQHANRTVKSVSIEQKEVLALWSTEGLLLTTVHCKVC